MFERTRCSFAYASVRIEFALCFVRIVLLFGFGLAEILHVLRFGFKGRIRSIFRVERVDMSVRWFGFTLLRSQKILSGWRYKNIVSFAYEGRKRLNTAEKQKQEDSHRKPHYRS